MSGRDRRFEAGDLLTVAQVGKILPIPRASLYRLIDSGRLPAVREPSVGRLLVFRDDLDDYIRTLRVRHSASGPRPASSPKTTDDILAEIQSEDAG